MAYPPKNGGLDVTTEKITQELQNAGVLYGFDTSTISYIEITKKYEEWVTVAKCKPAENGVDGTVEYLFSKESAGIRITSYNVCYTKLLRSIWVDRTAARLAAFSIPST